MNESVIKLIDEAYAKKSTFLDLGNCSLTFVPVEIAKLNDTLEYFNLGSWFEIDGEQISSSNNFAINDFSNNQTSLKNLLTLKKLKKLSVVSCNIDNVGVENISRLSSLNSLIISKNNIDEKGAEHISNISSLTHLNIHSNNIGEKGAKHISRLSSLTSLNIGINFIGDKGAEHVGKLSSLTSLDIEFNSIDERGAGHIGRISSLSSLKINYNNIGKKGAEHISSLSSLTSLDIELNQIGGRGAWYISQLSSLTSLNIKSNDIGEQGAKHISTLSLLTSLNIGFNSLGEKGAEHVGRLLSLDSLVINRNDIGDKGAGHISRLLSLTSLNIKYNRLGERGAEHIGRLWRLTSLNINSNGIGDEGARYISQLSSLTSLKIDGNDISEEGAEHIHKLSSLTNLDISSNNIGPKGAEYISKILSLNFLNISSNNIGVIGTKKISLLPSLTFLNIDANYIGEEGAKHISLLSSLTALYINDNKIGDEGAEFISRLSSLLSLEIKQNEISAEGAGHISKLSSLTWLNIGFNNLGEKGAEHISRLSNLTFLNINSNAIGDIGLNSIGNLKRLKSIYLTNNDIKHISAYFINSVNLEIDIEHDRDYYLEKIFLEGNPIVHPPQEVLKQGRLSVLEYLQEDLQSLNECKLIFVGEGSVGKTSLMKQLVYGTFDINEKTTHGINKIAWKGLKNKNGETIKINLWDFGGQHIQHSLHQFFFTERVVYVLVLNPRNDEKAHFWMDQVEKLGHDSQTLIVYNWKDEKEKEANYLANFYELRKKYPKLQDPILLSCKTGDSVVEFKDAIQTAILENESLRTKYPVKWFNIKARLENEIPIETNFIEYPKYEQWCEEENYNDPDKRINLLRILNSVGSIVFFDRPILNQLQVLNPEWITTGAYAIITSEKTNHTKGHLKWNDLKEIFKDEKEIFSNRAIKIKYTEAQFQFILQLMLDYRLCQKSPLEEHEYLIPSAFGEKPQRDYLNDNVAIRHYRLQFESPFEMLIIHRFIAKNIVHIVNKDYWNSGIYFKHTTSETYALVETNLYSKQINCWINGDNIRGLWEVIRNDFREIFRMYHNFPVKEEVLYISDSYKVFLPYQEMLNSLKNGVTVIDYHPTYELRNINVQNVLELFESREQTNRVMNNENIKIEVKPNIQVNPTITSNPEIIRTSNLNKEPLKENSKSLPSTNIQEENRRVKKWKSKATFIFTISLIITTLIIFAYFKEWFFSPKYWADLKKYDLTKWGGVVAAFLWNSFIGKYVYDRHFDPSKEKAFRDNLRQNSGSKI